MADRTEEARSGNYDTSIGTPQRSAVAATKLWAIVLGLIGLIGVVLIFTFMSSGGSKSTGPVSSDNTASRPASP